MAALTSPDKLGRLVKRGEILNFELRHLGDRFLFDRNVVDLRETLDSNPSFNVRSVTPIEPDRVAVSLTVAKNPFPVLYAVGIAGLGIAGAGTWAFGSSAGEGFGQAVGEAVAPVAAGTSLLVVAGVIAAGFVFLT